VRTADGQFRSDKKRREAGMQEPFRRNWCISPRRPWPITVRGREPERAPSRMPVGDLKEALKGDDAESNQCKTQRGAGFEEARRGHVPAAMADADAKRMRPRTTSSPRSSPKSTTTRPPRVRLNPKRVMMRSLDPTRSVCLSPQGEAFVSVRRGKVL